MPTRHPFLFLRQLLPSFERAMIASAGIEGIPVASWQRDDTWRGAWVGQIIQLHDIL
ncbi:MAG: hypothetical protein H0X37_07975 [Herpetosiphonaceae bacterium]|nr:hypothetical protein [Herpetosiphonaceae bacterium]